MHKIILSAIVVVLIVAFSITVHAEIYQGIGPLDTLGDVKAKFPNAIFQRSYPAWAQEDDVMYLVTGKGISGKIVIKFTDSRPFFRQMIEKEPSNKELYNSLANAPDDEIMVSWVRWMPDKPIPIQRFISKYGIPDKADYDSDDLQPYKMWETRGLLTSLSDDEKYVTRVDYSFTRNEYRKAYQSKYGFIPDWLKEKEQPKEQKTTRDKKKK
jgi:hypothetical protein